MWEGVSVGGCECGRVQVWEGVSVGGCEGEGEGVRVWYVTLTHLYKVLLLLPVATLPKTFDSLAV